MTFGKDGYYTLRGILGYNCKYNIVLSERGIGKSYGTKLFLMNQEGTFMCLYRQSSDMAYAMESWVDPLLEQGYHAEQFEWEGNDKEGWQLVYNGSVKGYFRYLTAVNHIKQEKFPDDLNWIWFDEFIPLVYKKLPGVVSEGDAIRAIVKTVEHDTIHTREEKGLKPVRVIMFANPFTWDNPILGYFKVRPRYGIHKVGPGVVVELIEPKVECKKGKMTVDQFLGDEVNKNQAWKDQQAFVLESWPKDCIPYMSMRLGTMYFAVYRKGNKAYIKQTDRHIWKPEHVMVLGTLDGLKEYEECIEYWKSLNVFKGMCYKGKVWFDSLNTKFNFLNAIS